MLGDFIAWRDEAVSIKPLGAFWTTEHNLISADGRSEAITVAQIDSVRIRGRTDSAVARDT